MFGNLVIIFFFTDFVTIATILGTGILGTYTNDYVTPSVGDVRNLNKYYPDCININPLA